MTFHLEILRHSGPELRRVDPAGEVGIAAGPCPGCGVEPFAVVGGGLVRVDADTWRAEGHCQACGDPVGYLYARRDTLFGAEEDAAVLEHGRSRVY